METIIVYKSNTGFTKEYAELLKPRIEADELIEIKKFNKKMIKEAYNLVFLGPLRNNVIEGLNKFLNHYDSMKEKNIFILCTGIQPITKEKRDDVVYANALQKYHVRLYLLPGGMDLSRYQGLKRKLITMIINIASKSRPELKMIKDQHINLVNGYNLDQMVNVFYKVNNTIDQ